MAIKETELFAPTKTWLEYNGYKVYSEVVPKRLSTRADVVGVNDVLTTVVELKTSLSLDLLEQAIDWIPYAHYIYVCVPKAKKRNALALKILSQYGIGMLEVDLKRNDIQKVLSPKINRKISSNIKDSLTIYHDKYSPDGGTKGGGYITEYRITIIKVKEFLAKARRGLPIYHIKNGKYQQVHNVDGWLSLNDILDYCETHYSSPKQSLAYALMNFENDWCESMKIGRKLHYRIKETK